MTLAKQQTQITGSNKRANIKDEKLKSLRQRVRSTIRE